MINIEIDESFYRNENNSWSYDIDYIEKEWDIEDDDELDAKAAEVLRKYNIDLIDDEEYEQMSQEEKDAEEEEFLKILYTQFEDFITGHIIFIIERAINVTNDAYYFMCFDLIAKSTGYTAIEKLYQWKNTAINHKFIVENTAKEIINYFEEYLTADNYRENMDKIMFYKNQWENVINHFMNSIIKRIDEYNEGKKYELYS